MAYYKEILIRCFLMLLKFHGLVFPLNLPVNSSILSALTGAVPEISDFIDLWKFSLDVDSSQTNSAIFRNDGALKTLVIPSDRFMINLIPQDTVHILYLLDNVHTDLRLTFLRHHLIPETVNPEDISRSSGKNTLTLSGKSIQFQVKSDGTIIANNIPVLQTNRLDDGTQIFILREPLFQMGPKVREAFDTFQLTNHDIDTGFLSPFGPPGPPGLPSSEFRPPQPPSFSPDFGPPGSFNKNDDTEFKSPSPPSPPSSFPEFGPPGSFNKNENSKFKASSPPGPPSSSPQFGPPGSFLRKDDIESKSQSPPEIFEPPGIPQEGNFHQILLPVINEPAPPPSHSPTQQDVSGLPNASRHQREAVGPPHTSKSKVDISVF